MSDLIKDESAACLEFRGHRYTVRRCEDPASECVVIETEMIGVDNYGAQAEAHIPVEAIPFIIAQLVKFRTKEST